MTDRINLFGYTPAKHPYPEFISLNKETDGRITLTVREPAKPGPYSEKDCGNTVEVEMPRDELLKLYRAIGEELTPPMMKARGIPL